MVHVPKPALHVLGLGVSNCLDYLPLGHLLDYWFVYSVLFCTWSTLISWSSLLLLIRLLWRSWPVFVRLEASCSLRRFSWLVTRVRSDRAVRLNVNSSRCQSILANVEPLIEDFLVLQSINLDWALKAGFPHFVNYLAWFVTYLGLKRALCCFCSLNGLLLVLLNAY